MIKKKVDLGEYVVKIFYDKNTGDLDIEVIDELGDIIESMNITNDENDEEDLGIDYNLN